MKSDALEKLKAIIAYCHKQAQFYTSWGNVDVLQVAIKGIDGTCFYTKENANLSSLNNDEVIQDKDSASLFNQLFQSRKNINCIFITRQEYASQIKAEIPPILDDQAQLLGVSIRVAKNEKEILHVLKNRLAAILPDGNSICIGVNYEDAYVAAQLLEKTSKAFIEAQYAGGAKSINKIEAWLMQKFYQLKYAKQAK